MSLFDKKYLKRIDWVTVGIVLALVVFGTIALASVQAKPFDGTEHGIAVIWTSSTWNTCRSI